MVRFKDTKASELTLVVNDTLNKTGRTEARMSVAINRTCVSSSDLTIGEALDIVKNIPKGHTVTVWEFCTGADGVVDSTHIDFGKQDNVLVSIVFDENVSAKVEGWAR